MDTFARSLLIANEILFNSEYKAIRTSRYASFDNGDGKAFEQGKLSLEVLRSIALKSDEPKSLSGKQELIEQLISMYI